MKKLLSRAEFLQATMGGASALLFVGACGESDKRPDARKNADSNLLGPDARVDAATRIDSATARCTSDTTGMIAGNHGHSLIVSAGDAAAGVDTTYDIMGASGHTHAVTVTAAHFTTLKGGGTVVIESTSGAGHTHSVTIMCA